MKIKAHLLLFVMVKFASTQFMNRRHSKAPCEVRGTALVEQFFNVIFAEFQHSPPTCTCVQMCAHQPTYCYPNGCFNKAQRMKNKPVSSIQQDAKTMFLFDDEKDVAEDLVGKANNKIANNLMDLSAQGNTEKRYQRPWKVNSLGRFNPFKEIVFKYNRVPKLKMKYNLREQIKHARDKKAEVDLSKTRWPTNKGINRQMNERSTNYLTEFPEVNQPKTSKYFKRYLTKRENQIGLDISALYLYKDASNFSLETLIDNLIERGLEGVDSTSTFRLSNSSKENDLENNSDSKFMNTVVEDPQNNTNEFDAKITLLTNWNNDRQNDSRVNQTNSTTAAYFEMITALSKKIETQNNKTMELIGNKTGNTFNYRSNGKSANLNANLNSTATETTSIVTSKLTEEVQTTTDIVPTNPFASIINSQAKKSKQRIVRKLRNRKLN